MNSTWERPARTTPTETEVPVARLSGAAGLAAAALEATGDGIAYAARLVRRALGDLTTRESAVVELGATGAEPVALRTRLQFLARLTHMQSREHVDWVVFTHVGIARAQLRVPRVWRRPYAVLLHGIEVWNPRLDAERKAALRHARVRIAISPHTARKVAATHPDLPPAESCLLGLLPEEPRIERAAPGDVRVDYGSRAVVVVGRMSSSERYKGHDQLILAMPRVLAEVPDAALVCVGRGDDVERLRAKAAAVGVARHVHFPGFVPDGALGALLNHAAMFAMPSRGEGFGLVYLQAMRAGIPCLGSREDAAADIILDGETGFLVPQQEPDAIAGATVRLLTDEPLRRRLGAAGRRRYETVFSYARFRARFAEVLARAFPPEPAAR